MSELLVVTIGESPRKDIEYILKENLPKSIKIIQRGVLDNLSNFELEEISTVTEQTSNLVTRLKDGNSIIINANIVEEKVQEIILKAEAEGFRNVLLLCTGSFPNLDSKSLNIFMPDPLISPVIKEIGENKKMGLLIPDQSQERDMFLKWEGYNLKPFILASSPYSKSNNIEEIAKRFEAEKVDFILMDCMGYTPKFKVELSGKINMPVILSNTLMAKILSEII